MKTPHYLPSPHVHAACMAARFAQELGYPAGNMWEPPIARNLLSCYREWGSWLLVEKEYRVRLGLSR